ncbi:MAG: HEAT repeat domain-containing protein [Cyanobacteria bacterium P01_H01_bin.74]
MALIHIKKLERRDPSSGDFIIQFAVPSVAIQTPQGKKLIPNPAGTEAAIYDNLHAAESAIRLAGFDYEFEGKVTQTVQQNLSSAGLAQPKQQYINLSKNPMQDAEDILVEQLTDKESSVVSNAVMALGAMRVYRALPDLIELLGHDDPLVRKNLADALARFGGQALPSLKAAFLAAKSNQEKQSPYIRLTVINALLALLNQPEGVHWSSDYLPLALEALNDDSWLVRSQAALLFANTAFSLEELRLREKR